MWRENWCSRGGVARLEFGRNKRCSGAEQQPSRTVIGGGVWQQQLHREYFLAVRNGITDPTALQAGMCGASRWSLHGLCIWQRAWHAARGTSSSKEPQRIHCQHPATHWQPTTTPRVSTQTSVARVIPSSHPPYHLHHQRHTRHPHHRRDPESSTLSSDPCSVPRSRALRML